VTIKLHYYQREAVDAIQAAYARGVKRPAIVHATGAGKSVALSKLASEHLRDVGGRGAVVAHRIELIENNAREISDVDPTLNVGVVKGNRNETRADVVSCSVQTLAGERRRQMLADVSLVIIDECHRAAAKSYLDILRHYGCYGANGQGAHAAGFTATMVRGDDKALGDVWQEIVHTKDIASLVQEGFLVRPRGLRVRVEDLDLSKVKRSGGDYQADALGEALEQSLAPEAIAKAMREHAADRRTVLFAPTVHSAGVICEALKDSGFTAAVVHAGTPDVERRQVAEDSRTGKVQIVCNALLYTEGTNWPWLSCVVIARPTRSKGTFVQMAGRGLRLYPGKSDCLIMMIGGSAAGHSLLAPVELFGASAEEIDRDPCSCVPGRRSTLDAIYGGCECGRRRCTEFCPCGGGGQDCGCPRPQLGDELEESDDLGELLEDIGANGPLVAHEVDLFAGSTSAWDQTYGGVWFLPAGKERLIAIVPGDPAERGGWDVVAMNAKGPGSRWVVKGVSELAYAMAHADGEVTTAEATIARKEARWRSGRPSDAAADLARRMGIPGVELMSAGEVSRHLTKTFASRRIDPRVPEYARRQLVNA
jgi:superfamily II DNA or RNA helicase